MFNPACVRPRSNRALFSYEVMQPAHGQRRNMRHSNNEARKGQTCGSSFKSTKSKNFVPRLQ